MRVLPVTTHRPVRRSRRSFRANVRRLRPSAVASSFGVAGPAIVRNCATRRSMGSRIDATGSKSGAEGFVPPPAWRGAEPDKRPLRINAVASSPPMRPRISASPKCAKRAGSKCDGALHSLRAEDSTVGEVTAGLGIERGFDCRKELRQPRGHCHAKRRTSDTPNVRGNSLSPEPIATTVLSW